MHQDHPDLYVVLRMSLSLWTALLTQPPNLPTAVGCLLGDARVARQGIMVCWSVWSGALLFDILHSHKRLSGSSMPVIYGDMATVWCYMPVATRWGEDTPTCSPSDPTWLVKSQWVVNEVGLRSTWVFFTVAVQSLLLLVRLCGLYPLSLFSFDQSPPLQTHDRQRLTPHQAYQDKAHVFVQNGTTKSHSYTLKQLF